MRLLKRLLAKLCFDASFLCLHRFVAFHVTFNDLCCSLQPCGSLSWIHLWVTNQSLQTGQNDSVIHFEVAFGIQLDKFVQITQNFVISLLIEDIKTNPPIGKHTLDVFT